MAITGEQGVAAAERAGRAWLGGDVAGPPVRLGGSGFSGSAVFVIARRSTGERFVLKAFTAETPPARGRWVHALATHLRQRGIVEAPDVVATHRAAGDTLCAREGILWELVRFVSGMPTCTPTEEQAAAAARALARLHVEAATFPGGIPALGPSPGLSGRSAQAARLAAVPWDALPDHAARRADDLLERTCGLRARAAASLRRPGCLDAIAAVATWKPGPVVTQAVLRDIWSDHVLFASEAPARVAGIIDMHAAGCDTPATDLARLLGSWRPRAVEASSPSLLERWPQAIAAYERVRPLSASERRLVDALDATAVILGLDNWFRWVVHERRTFERPELVIARIEALVERLPEALARLMPLAAGPV